MRQSAFLILSMAVTASISLAQDQTTDLSERKFDTIFSAQSMMQREIVDESGVSAGVIGDIILDVQNGRVALLIIKRSNSAVNTIDSNAVAFEQFAVVPSVIQDWKSDEPFELSIPLKQVQSSSAVVEQKSLTSFSESDLAAIYRHYEADLYWKSTKGNTAVPSLMSIDELDGKLIRDADRSKLGRIEEVLLAPDQHWSIAFLALSQFRDHGGSQDRIAIPLSALARRRSSSAWLLEISKEAKLPGETFIAGQWPTVIDAGWVEFTHVKYGASTDGGIQTPDDPIVHSEN